MASIDWQTSLSTTFKLISTSILHLLTGLYWLTLWIVLNVAASAPRYILKTASVILTPLTYLLYQVWRVFAFLSSPIQAFGRVILGMGGLIIGFIVKFKYLYIFFAIAGLLGVASAGLLFGTSNILFSMLGISSSAQYTHKNSQLRLQSIEYSEQDNELALREDDDSDGGSLSTTDYDDALQESGPPRQHGGRPGRTNQTFEQAYRQAKSTRMSPIKPSRRFRGLLAQTIHEESSESD